jgi:hypothetical protein
MKRSPLGRWPSVLGCSLERRHDGTPRCWGPGSRFPWGSQAKQKLPKRKPWSHPCISCMPPPAIIPGSGQKITTTRHVGQVAPSPAAILRSPPTQPQRDNVLFSALESFLEDFTTLWPFPRSLPDLTECLTTIIQDLSLESIKYHARVQSQITPN